MKQYFTEQLKTNSPKLFYFVMNETNDSSVSLTFESIEPDIIDTLSDNYTYVEQRNNFPVFVRKLDSNL